MLGNCFNKCFNDCKKKGRYQFLQKFKNFADYMKDNQKKDFIDKKEKNKKTKKN